MIENSIFIYGANAGTGLRSGLILRTNLQIKFLLNKAMLDTVDNQFVHHCNIE